MPTPVKGLRGDAAGGPLSFTPESREALDQVFLTQAAMLDAVNVLVLPQPVPLSDGAMAVPVPPHDIPLPAQQRAVQRQVRRQALHTHVWALHRQGWTAPAIAQHLGMGLRTVQRDLQSATFTRRKRRSNLGESVLNPYKPYLLERWNAGCYTAMQLFRELEHGAIEELWPRGCLCAPRPPGPGLASAPAGPADAAGRGGAPLPPFTPRRATWLVLRRAEKCGPRPRPSSSPTPRAAAMVAEAIDLAQDFHTRPPRQPGALDPWLPRAATSALEAITLCHRAPEDYDAVKAGVTLPWSSGPVEGHINRLKMLKRQMFGRAHLDLLSGRFLRAPRERPLRAVGPRAPSQGHAEAQTA